MDILRWPWLTGPAGQTGLVALGILLRLRHYLENRSFWQDELCLALSIINRPFDEIWHHVLLFPDFAQAPLLFQFMEKAMVSILGNSELSLRFFPLLASIASIFLARRLFRRYLDPAPATLALALFVLIEPLVYFAAELKPYGVDVLAALLVHEMFAALKNTWDTRRLLVFAVAGAVIIWFSNAMLFLLAGCGLVLLWEKVQARDRQKAAQLLACYGVWLLSFVLLYSLSLSRMLNPDLLKNWRSTGAFSAAPIWTLDGLAWAWRVFLEMFRTPLGLGWPYGAAFFFIWGCCVFFRRDRRLLALLLLPLLLTLLAAAFEKYPFYERLILFLVPALLVVLARGVNAAAAKAGSYRPWLAACVITAVLAYPLLTAAQNIVKLRGYEQNREAMGYLAAHYQPGDLIAISPQAQYPFWYYGQRLGLNQRLPLQPVGEGLYGAAVIQLFPDVIVREGKDFLALRRTVSLYDRQGYYRKFMLTGKGGEAMFIAADAPALLKGMGRVWVFLSHHNTPGYPAFVDRVFSRAGQRLDAFERPGVSLFLYNSSREN